MGQPPEQGQTPNPSVSILHTQADEVTLCRQRSEVLGQRGLAEVVCGKPGRRLSRPIYRLPAEQVQRCEGGDAHAVLNGAVPCLHIIHK